MSWNYRVIKTKFKAYGKDEEVFRIYEVYYSDKEDNHKPFTTTKNPCYPQGETLGELKEDLEAYSEALDRPVLDMEYFESDECEKLGEKYLGGNENDEDNIDLKELKKRR